MWGMVGLPLLFHGGLDPRRLAAWAVVYTAFAVALWLDTGGRRRSVLLPLEVACVLAMVMLLCDGFEGALLVLVALQLGPRVSLRAGIAWVVLQTALLALAISLHWTPNAALLLAPPYLGFQLLALLVAGLVARHAEARGGLAKANEELRAAQALADENSRLAERLHISRELHDLVGHRLTALSLNLEAAVQLAQGRAAEPVASAQSLAKLVLADVRGVVAQLRDEDRDRVDLTSALRAISTEMPRPRVHLALPESLARHDGRRALTLLRCAQEIVTNAARHADAQNLWIDLVEEGGNIELRAKDDGIGALEVTLGDGLRGMRERLELDGGRLEITTKPGDGFSLRATLPLAGVA